MTDSSALLNVGFEYPQWEVRALAADQAEKLACCDIDPATYGNRADITYFAHESIMATKHAGITINGSVHMEQTFELRQPVYLGEPLIIRGSVIGVEPDPRGHRIRSQFDFVRPDGTVPLSTERMSLRIDPDAGTTGPVGSSQTITEPRLAELVRVGEKQLHPERVAKFSLDAENLIHSEPEVAKAFGFRAPIAGGLMAVRFMMEALSASGPPDEIRMVVRFRRPMFWDERLDLFADVDEAPMQTLAVAKADGKIANMATVERFVPGSA
ncbi:MAG: hypothetical protein K0U93_02005 [Gammaproteobacteria bacterium]|nr:hypothetical protein [Gammaproteobacteria bacterium]